MELPEDELSAEEIAFARSLLREPEALLPYVEALPDERACAALKAIMPIIVRHWRRVLHALAAQHAQLTAGHGGWPPRGDA
jgi:hypothetical protein